jgi:hypothetical protein
MGIDLSHPVVGEMGISKPAKFFRISSGIHMAICFGCPLYLGIGRYKIF